MEQIKQDIKQIIGQAQQLSSRYEEALKTLTDLRSQLQSHETDLREKEEQIRTLAEENKLLRLAGSVSEGQPEKDPELRKEINKYIKQIDKCIALLKT